MNSSRTFLTNHPSPLLWKRRGVVTPPLTFLMRLYGLFISSQHIISSQHVTSSQHITSSLHIISSQFISIVGVTLSPPFPKEGPGWFVKNVPTSFPTPSLWEDRGGLKEGPGWFVKQCPNLFSYPLPLGGLGWVKGGAGVVCKKRPNLFYIHEKINLSNPSARYDNHGTSPDTRFRL